MTAPAIDPGHHIPDSEWVRVEREAKAIASAEELKTARGRERRMRGLLSAKVGRSAFPSVTGFVQAKYSGGPQPAGGPKFGVLHDAETPLANGYAGSIAGYFSRNTNETSAHFMVGPDAVYQLLDTGLIAWHCGNGNQRSIGVEQTGYASFSTAQWTTPAGLAQMGRVAALMRDIHAVHGIGLFWMTDQQLLDAYAGRITGGWATHSQCSRVLGGSTHTDPMPNYPRDQLMALAQPPAPTPTPTPEADVQLSDTLPNANPDTKAKKPTQTVSDLLQDVQANAFSAARLESQALPLIQAQGAAITALSQLVAQQNGLTAADVTKAVADAIAAGVKVDVSVHPAAGV